MNVYKKIAILVLSAVLMVAGCNKEGESKSATQTTLNRLLIVFSGNKNSEWAQQIEAGGRHFYAQKKYKIETIYLNINPGSSQAVRQEAGNYAKETFESFKPHVVLAVGDPAQAHFARDLAGREDVKVVFCAVEQELATYGYPATNVTGILMRPPFTAAFKLLGEVAPGLSACTVLTDTSEQGASRLEYLQEMELPWEITVHQVENFSDWQEKVHNATSGAVILLSHNAIADVEGTPELLTWTAENLKVPSLAFSEDAVKRGILLGVGSSPYELGSKAGIYVSWILEGKPTADIPIDRNQQGLSYLNGSTAARLGLETSGVTVSRIIE